MIEIRDRFCPFSHTPGIKCLLPGSFVIVQVFPGKLYLEDLQNGLSREFFWDIQGPVRGFTCEEDLEKGIVRVFGNSEGKFFRYTISSLEKGVQIHLEKGYLGDELKSGKKILPFKTFVPFSNKERLSLGVNKQQEWEMVRRRLDFREIFPFWLKLANFFQPLTRRDFSGTAVILKECQSKIEKAQKKEVLLSFEKLFLSSFSAMLVPRLFDDEYQNLVKVKEITSNEDPFIILTEGARLIRRLFIEEKTSSLSLLPCLPASFTSGRFINLALAFGTLDMEWSKKILRRVILKANKKANLNLTLQPEIKRFRMRFSTKERGSTLLNETSIILEPGRSYLFDRFLK